VFLGSAAGTHGLVVAPIEYVRRLVEAGERPALVDLRPASEYRSGRLPGARSMPLPELDRRYDELPRGQLVVLYCACSRVELEGALRLLWSRGYENTSVMLEGFGEWLSRGYPVER
jgi:rhodanese-related sulfurtransferase